MLLKVRSEISFPTRCNAHGCKHKLYIHNNNTGAVPAAVIDGISLQVSDKADTATWREITSQRHQRSLISPGYLEPLAVIIFRGVVASPCVFSRMYPEVSVI